MDFSPTEDQQAIRDSVARLCAGFDIAYWQDCDANAAFPRAFFEAMAAAGWLGICVPADYGGAGLGVTEACLLMHQVATGGGGFTASSTIHINIFGPHPIIVFGTEDQKRRWLPDLAAGRVQSCFGVTEPNAGLNTTAIETRAERTNTGHVVHGRKIWTSTAQEAGKIMLLTRTTPLDQCRRPTDGMTLFYTDLNRRHVEIRPIPKMGRAAVDSNMLFIDGLPVPDEDRIGLEGHGFEYVLHSLNPERCLVAAEAIGIGQDALRRASAYARERVVFGRPIGKNQGIQHPLAESWMELEAAWLMCQQAAWLYDQGKPCALQANAAKYLGAEAGFRACTNAVMTHGGMGYAKEYVVERLLREVLICRLAPVSPQLILCHIAEKALGLPKSY